jgi:hypothetical protein
MVYHTEVVDIVVTAGVVVVLHQATTHNEHRVVIRSNFFIAKILLR